MSVVTNLILAYSASDIGTDIDESPTPAEQYLIHHLKSVYLNWPASVDKVTGGSKYIECGLKIWGANCLDLEAFLDIVTAAPWREPEEVQVFAKREEERIFTVYQPCLGKEACR